MDEFREILFISFIVLYFLISSLIFLFGVTYDKNITDGKNIMIEGNVYRCKMVLRDVGENNE